MLHQQDLKGHDHAAEVALVAELLIVPLGILNIVHGDHGVIFLECTRADTSEFLHVSTHSEYVSDVNTEGSHVGASLARHPEDAHVSLLVVVKQLALVDRAHTQLLLDGGDQRRTLEHGASETQQGLLDLLDLVDVLMELHDCDVLFTS